MAPRACLPGEFFLDAAVTNTRAQFAQWSGAQPNRSDWAVVEPPSGRAVEEALRLPPFVALRWVLNASLGIPLAPFTVWRRPVGAREPMAPIASFRALGDTAFAWDGITEMMRIELDVTGSVAAFGLTTRSDPVATASSPGGATTLVLEGGPMLALRLSNPVAISAVRGLSAVAMVNGGGWKPIEHVGLPVDPGRFADVYYRPDGQGPEGSPMDPRDAAVDRLKRWGPRLGWATLTGLPPWQAPDPGGLLAELDRDLLGALQEVMTRQPPPMLDLQVLEEVIVQMPRLRQIAGATRALNTGGADDRSEARVRPLSALTAAVASDAWASLALGFGTGAERGDARKGIDDFMVTAPWRGRLKVKPPATSPFPFLGFPEPDEITVEVERELAAVVLSPQTRASPAAPSPVATDAAFPEGAPELDAPYRMATRILTDRRAVLPARPRVAAYAMARFDDSAKGAYAMRPHPKAGGWLPLASALPVPDPLQPPDPALPAGKAVLRDSGVPVPVSGPAQRYQYAVAAADLFGQWSPWTTAWLSLPPAGIVAPGVPSVRAKATAGAGNADPCRIEVTVEVTWEWRERSCASITLALDVFDPIPPPATIPPPPPSPTPSATVVTIAFDPAGTPSTAAPGVRVQAISDDGATLFPGAHPAGTVVRRFRIVVAALPVTYAGTAEKAVAAYARGVERLRPGEPSLWTSAREAAIAPNPIAPATPPPLPAVFPNWASLPDPAGLSSAPVTWAPSGAPAYRVYVATEAALLAACDQPGPVLTMGYAARMQALFDLYKIPANRPKLRAAYRKVDAESLTPPVANGQMRHEVVLPRGSSLIHAFIVVGLTPANVVSSWPDPDADGRRGFIPFAIPHPIRTAEPEMVATLDDAGVPVVTVRVAGAVPARTIRLYRTQNARLARTVGTMQLVATVPTDPAHWATTSIADPSAPAGWQRLHYRAVALTDDDLDRAGMAIPSASRADYALLRPPAEAPALALAPNVPGSTATVAVVAVATDAPRATTDIGDHLLSLAATSPDSVPLRFSAPLSGLALFATATDLAAGADTAGYVTAGGAPALHLRLPRPAGAEIALTLDLVDPLGRARRATLTVPPLVVDPAPLITAFTLLHPAGVITGRLTTNAPGDPDPARPWTLTLTTRVGALGNPGLPGQRRSFDLSTMTELASPADLPQPAANPALRFAIGRLRGTGQILFWTRSVPALRIAARLDTPDGQSVTSTKVSP